VMVILENQGEHDVQPGDYFVQLKGFSPSDFDTSTDALIVYPEDELLGNELIADDNTVIESDPVYVQVPGDGSLAYQSDLAGPIHFPFRVEVCYKYMTYANAKLCIKEELTKTTEPTVCTISGIQEIASSAGPVQFTDFKEFGGGPGAVRFSFKVVAGDTGGDISMRDSLCSSQTLDKNRVYVTVDTGISGLNCRGFLDGGSGTEGYVKLTNGYRQITCTQDVDDPYDGVSIVDLSAEYDYTTGYTQQVLVKPLIE